MWPGRLPCSATQAHAIYASPNKVAPRRGAKGKVIAHRAMARALKTLEVNVSNAGAVSPLLVPKPLGAAPKNLSRRESFIRPLAVMTKAAPSDTTILPELTASEPVDAAPAAVDTELIIEARETCFSSPENGPVSTESPMQPALTPTLEVEDAEETEQQLLDMHHAESAGACPADLDNHAKATLASAFMLAGSILSTAVLTATLFWPMHRAPMPSGLLQALACSSPYMPLP
eukprot:CAMPEP_0174711570 /NCGR_PEP_ID=MMETSP1094-20130205/12853_1 /TAXON_ID=156173 /ORGANISM="Chrysochromulina brevifilum, Strain UTEX LB 985" /LENGTH=230 /DNA_ID=CAMNT_0015910529 /DNA_START=96 /DNA_END=788 /DNA_ORIENTATION=-